MTNADRLPAPLLQRKAVVYVRQSTQAQVQMHTESKRRQYELVGEAKRRGFRDIEVIDDDLGRSASGTVARPGFERLVALLCAGEVGAVLCLDASRLARNGRDWHHLLELCGLVQARVIDLDGVYDPCRPNDRLLLGMKGSISEFELNVLRTRMLDAAERLAAQLVASTLNSRKHETIRACFARLERDCVSANERVVAEADFAFHKAIIDLSEHARLKDQYEVIERQIRIYIRSSDALVENGEAIIEQHRPIAEAIMAGDVEEAGKLSEAHNLTEGKKLTSYLLNLDSSEAGANTSSKGRLKNLNARREAG